MKITINTARRYSDLNTRLYNIGIFENDQSDLDVKVSIDLLLNTYSDIELVTLHDGLINLIGKYISEGQINKEDVTINIYENGMFKQSSFYDENGYLDDGWICGLLSF